MLRFYLDEHQPNSLAKELRKAGIDVQTAVEARMAGHKVPDPIQLAWAAIGGRVFVTGDWDFLVYGATVHPHAGVVIIRALFPLVSPLSILNCLPMDMDLKTCEIEWWCFQTCDSTSMGRPVAVHSRCTGRDGAKAVVNVSSLSETAINYRGQFLVVEHVSS